MSAPGAAATSAEEGSTEGPLPVSPSRRTAAPEEASALNSPVAMPLNVCVSAPPADALEGREHLVHRAESLGRGPSPCSGR